MAKSNLYSIYDVVAKEAGPVWNAKNDEVAVRQLTYLLTGEAGRVSNPEDYHLYCIGVFDADNVVVAPDRRLIPVNMQNVLVGE